MSAREIVDMPDRGSFVWLASYPAGSCDITSYVIGNELLDRGLGDWNVVTGMALNRTDYANHTWLEFREAGTGAVLFTIDASAHQFSDLALGPVFVTGAGPARDIFEPDHHEFRVGELPHWWPKPEDKAALAYVRSRRVGSKRVGRGEAPVLP